MTKTRSALWPWAYLHAASMNLYRRSASALEAFKRGQGSTSPSTSMARAAAFSRPSFSRNLVWDFRLPRVKSINTSGHKFGLAPPGVGWTLWREQLTLTRNWFSTSTISADHADVGHQFSRPGGEIVASITTSSASATRAIAKSRARARSRTVSSCRQIDELGPFEMSTMGTAECPGSLEIERSRIAEIDPLRSCRPLRDRGWHVPAYSMPANREDLVIQRILIRHGFYASHG